MGNTDSEYWGENFSVLAPREILEIRYLDNLKLLLHYVARRIVEDTGAFLPLDKKAEWAAEFPIVIELSTAREGWEVRLVAKIRKGEKNG